MMFFSGVKELRENGVSQRAFWCVKMSLSCWYKVTTSSPVSKERKDWVGKTNKGQLQGCLAAPGHQNVNSRIVYFPWNGICNISTYGWKWKSSNCLFLLGQDVHKLKNHSPIFYAYLTYKLGQLAYWHIQHLTHKPCNRSTTIKRTMQCSIYCARVKQSFEMVSFLILAKANYY